jgi:hypothetical protein
MVATIQFRTFCLLACYLFLYLLQIYNLLHSLLSKIVKIRIYKTVIMPALLYACETWFLTLREEHRHDVREQGAEENIWIKER